jgi:glucose/arabinose dehydrogenase
MQPMAATGFLWCKKAAESGCTDPLGIFWAISSIIPGIGGGGEGGLLSMVFHPDYADNGLFYVYYTNAAGDLDLARYQVYPNNPDLANPSSKVLLLSIPHPDIYHYGGELHFGNDGYLYLSTGDGGNPGDMVNNAQNPNVLLGKLLRIAVDTSSVAPYYSIPADNPFGNEVYALGFRNPFRWSFDRLTHDIWVADVGSSIREEINFLPAGSSPGANFGWSCLEGEFSFNPSFCLPGLTTITPAFAYYSLPPVSVIGGVVYRGTSMPDLQGYYMTADYFSGNWYLLSPDGNGGWNNTIQTLPVKGIADFGESENGDVYVVSTHRKHHLSAGISRLRHRRCQPVLGRSDSGLPEPFIQSREHPDKLSRDCAPVASTGQCSR